MTHAKRTGYFLSGLAFTFLNFVSYAMVQPPQTCVPPPSSMVSWWPGDGDANDITGGNHGTLQNGATFAAGLVGQSFSFVGPDDIVRVPHSFNLNVGTGDVTIDAWMQFSDPRFTNDRVIMMKFSTNPSDAPFPGYTVRWLGDKLQFIIDSELGGVGPSVQDKKVEATITRDINWHHVAAVRRGLTMELYYDGVLVASATHSTLEDADNTADVGIGNNVGEADNGFPSLIDELEFLNRALIAGEIAAIYNAGSAGKCKDADSDGVPDNQDNCPNSIVNPTVVIGGCDSKVLNAVSPNGCTLSDRIQHCVATEQNHGQFVSCVAHLTNELKRDGVITGQQEGTIQSCAAQANIP